MPKILTRFFAALSAAALLTALTACGHSPSPTLALSPMRDNGRNLSLMSLIDPASEVRGVYIATVHNIDFPSRPDLSAHALKVELDTIIENTLAAGLNTIYFQVRPAADALYDSEIFPISEALSSRGELTLDPLAYLVEKAHQANLFVHAWVNPLRVTVGYQTRPQTDISALPDNSPAKAHPEWIVAYADGKLYFDPAYPEVRELIAAGVGEIVENYNVDGILFDDYFYPYPVTDENGVTVGFDDSVSFALYGQEMSLGDFRRENVNKMIEQVYDTVKEISSEVKFGVAPFGIWKNNDGENGGSATRGLESYFSIYCDPVAWANGGYIDYIAPQLYWRFTTSVAPYDELVRFWNRTLDGTGVDLLISHGAYNYEDWDSPQREMAHQVEYARKTLTYRGSIFYGYDEIRKNTQELKKELRDTFSEKIIYTDPAPTGTGVQFTSPTDGTYINAASTTITGLSSPDKSLTLNGSPVNRGHGGDFSVTVNLLPGENRFIFIQDGIEYPITIHRGTAPV